MYRQILSSQNLPPCYNDCASVADIVGFAGNCKGCPGDKECDNHDCDSCDYADDCMSIDNIA